MSGGDDIPPTRPFDHIVVLSCYFAHYAQIVNALNVDNCSCGDGRTCARVPGSITSKPLYTYPIHVIYYFEPVNFLWQEELNTAIDAILQRLGTAATGTPTQPVEAVADGSQFAVGDMCLAPRVFDRRRALALVEAVDAPSGTCLVTWVHPRQKREIVCRYWKEVWHGNQSVIV